MELTTQQQNCIILAGIGDKLSYFNGLPFMNIYKSDINFKKKIISSEFKKLNSINLKKMAKFFKLSLVSSKLS